MTRTTIILTLMLPMITGFSQTGFVVKGGVNLVEWEDSEPSSQFENKFRVGLYTGFNTDLPIGPRMTIQSELQYAMFGSVVETAYEKTRYKANYLQLPVMAKYSLDNGLSFVCGPQAGVLVKAKGIRDGRKYDFSDGMNKTDVFLVLGADYKLRSGISLGFRYQHGLMHAANNSDPILKNRGFSVDVSYHLGDSVRDLLKKLL